MIRLRLAFVAVLIAVLVWHYQHAEGPTPGPDPDPTPTPTKGMKVLIVEESAGTGYTLAQRQALANAKSGEIDEWLDEHCGPDGNHVWDKDLDVSAQSQFWRDAWKMPREKDPSVRVFNGRRWLREQTFQDTDELKKAIGMK